MRQPKPSTPRRRNPSRLLALAVQLAAAGCGGGNSLDGSLSEAFDLSFSTVEVKRSPTALQVTYLQSEGREVSPASPWPPRDSFLASWTPLIPSCTTCTAISSALSAARTLYRSLDASCLC